MSEAHLYAFHGAFSYRTANHSRKKQQDTSDEMPHEDGGQPFCETERRNISSRENLRQGNRRAKPDQPIFK